MYNLIRDLFKLLTAKQRRKFYILQGLVILMALSEIVGVASIAPFMSLVGDVSMLERENFLGKLYAQTGLSNPYDFIFWVGIGVLISLTLSAFLSMITTWKLAMFAAEIGTENADRLYAYYLNQNWLFHSSGSSSQLVKQISTEAVRVTDLIILPLILMIAKLILTLFLLAAIVIYDPLVALFGVVLFSSLYVLLYTLVRKRLDINGQTLSEISTQRFRLMNEAFGGIKDVLLLNRKSYFNKEFEISGKKFAYARGNNHVLWQVPRYFMELIAFGAMIGLVLYLISSHQGDLGLILPILAVYALAGFKLLPAFQQIYSSLGQIRGNLAAFEAIKNDLLDSKLQDVAVANGADAYQESQLKPQHSIDVSGVFFTYPGKTKPALNDFSLTIPINTTVGIVGPSGSGKSTAIDVLLSIISPCQGEMKVDDIVIDENTKRSWQKTIGFVPQSIFLSEGTISENVAFGIPKNKINQEKVRIALGLAHLDELVDSLDNGINTKVGERGVQLSGGQRQRIGIARALYNDASILIFDEATSALDGITEKAIMDAIHDFSGKKTIVMIAHRLKTVQKCDQIFFIDQGKVTDQGTYEELVKKNSYFRKMAYHS